MCELQTETQFSIQYVFSLVKYKFLTIIKIEMEKYLNILAARRGKRYLYPNYYIINKSFNVLSIYNTMRF